MKLTISIPDNALSDVEEYCRIEGIDFEARIQQEVDRLVNNAIEQMEQRRVVNKVACELQDWFKGIIHIDKKGILNANK